MGEQRPELIQYLLSERESLRAQLAHRLGSPALAEEVLQQACLQLRCLPVVPVSGDPRRFLLTFATQLGIDRLLRERAAARLARQLAELRCSGPATTPGQQR
jgi:predicted RNA polymerase sigma factor